MKRQPDHVFSFFLAELGTTGSIDGTERMVIKGKYIQKDVERLLRKYISEFSVQALAHFSNYVRFQVNM